MVVTRADLFPANHGAAVKIDRTAWGLSRLDGNVYLVTDDRRQYHRYVAGECEAIPFPGWLANLGPWRRAMHLQLKRAGIPSEDVFLYYALMDWNLMVRAAYVAARHGARVYQAEFPAYARACLWVQSILGGHTALVEHNIEFDRLRDQVRDLSPQSYSFLRDVEITLCNSVDSVIAVSNRDGDCLVRNGVEPARVHVIPHGVDISSFDVPALSRGKLQRYGIESGRPILVYHGTYLYPPNLDAIQLLALEILPRLNASGLRPAVMAIGPGPPDLRLHPDIVFTGTVETVAPFLKAADVAVVPLRQGGGTRMKVLDYFAAGIPVVSTSKGVEGLDLSDGDQLLIRDGHDGFARAVEDLLRDPGQARALGAAGRQFVAQFDWVNIARRYLDLYAAASESRRAEH